MVQTSDMNRITQLESKLQNARNAFEAWELLKMKLKAETVVLSACDTARGRVGNGEGLIGMKTAP